MTNVDKIVEAIINTSLNEMNTKQYRKFQKYITSLNDEHGNVYFNFELYVIENGVFKIIGDIVYTIYKLDEALKFIHKLDTKFNNNIIKLNNYSHITLDDAKHLFFILNNYLQSNIKNDELDYLSKLMRDYQDVIKMLKKINNERKTK